MEKDKLLIVEDGDDLRSQIKWGLGQEYHILTASDRPDALKIFRSERPFGVNLDLGLPPLPGGVEEGFRALGIRGTFYIPYVNKKF